MPMNISEFYTGKEKQPQQPECMWNGRLIVREPPQNSREQSGVIFCFVLEAYITPFELNK